MRRKLLAALALSAALAVGVSAIASATSTTIHAGNLVVTFGGTVSPKALSKTKYTPITANLFGKIKTTDGTQPSAFREAVVDIDKDVMVNVKGYPVCKSAQLQATDTAAAKKACGSAILGEGSADAQIAFPEQKPILVHSPLLVFNGGQKGGKTLLLIHTFITVPVPAAIVTTVTVQKKGSGLHSIAKIPQIVGGSGSAVDFRFKLGKKYRYKGQKMSYLSAKCPDGVFKTKASALFKNEAHVAGVAATTTAKGKVAVPCTQKG
jgi:hypothetical protein